MLSFNRYKLDTIGIATNTTVNATEVDFGPMFLFGFRPAWWVCLDFNVGLGLRIFNTDDIVASQHSDGHITGVESDTSVNVILPLSIGLTFYFVDWMGAGGQYTGVWGMRQQMMNPTTDDRAESVTSRPWTHTANFYLAIRL